MVGRNVLNKTSSFYAWKHLIYLIELFFEYIIILLNYESKVSLLDAFLAKQTLKPKALYV